MGVAAGGPLLVGVAPIAKEVSNADKVCCAAARIDVNGFSLESDGVVLLTFERTFAASARALFD